MLTEIEVLAPGGRFTGDDAIDVAQPVGWPEETVNALVAHPVESILVSLTV